MDVNKNLTQGGLAFGGLGLSRLLWSAYICGWLSGFAFIRG